jgi:predicted transcriptional regulator
MTSDSAKDKVLTISVGRTPEQIGAAFVSTWQRAARGETVAPSRVLSFESWDALASVLTGERFRLLRHLHLHPEPSVSALARSLHRHLRRVQADVRALESAGLIDRSHGRVQTAVDRVTAEVQFG